MLKKAKLYSLLLVIVASTVVGLFGFSGTANADVSWVGNPSSAMNGYHQYLEYDDSSYPDGNGQYTYHGSAAQLGLGDDCSGAPLVYVKVADNIESSIGGVGSPPGGLHVICFKTEASGSEAIYAYYPRATLNSGKINDCALQNPPDDEQNLYQDTNCTGIGVTTFAVSNPPDLGNAQEQFEEDTDILQNGESENPSSCQIKGIGWLVCPVVMFLAEMVDASYFLLDRTLLRLEPIVLPGGDEGEGIALYNTWKGMRDFANIIFIIGFLLIVFSQITSIGISNYGIKRMLPKIIAAAILVNISFYICAIGVDLSNIIGNSMRGLFDSAVVQNESSGIFSISYTPHNPDCGTGCEPVELDTWQKLVYAIIGGAGVGLGTALAGVALFHLLPVLLPMIMGAALAVITVVLALTIRQALIVILIVISPLAFVALLLPNTEDYFKKWRSLFMAMLLVYPIISVVFGASALASRILMATDDFPVQLIGAGVSVIPLFLTPIIMKVSGGLLNRWVGLVNDPSKGWVDSKRNALAEQGKLISEQRKTGSIERSGRFVGSNGNRLTRRFLGGANSLRRRAFSVTSPYGERVRKDGLSTAESDNESAYLGTEGGRTARNTSKNAQINLSNAQINTESIRLESAEGIRLQVAATSAETRKHAAEAEAQTAAIRAIPHALEERAILADTNKKAAEDEGKAHALTAVASNPVGQAALARAEDAKNANTAAEKNASRVGLTGANRATAAAAETATLEEKRAEDNLARDIAPLVSQTARTAAINAENQKKRAEDDERTTALRNADMTSKVQASTAAQNLASEEAYDKQINEEVAARGITDLANFDPAAFGVSHAAADAAQTSRFQKKAIDNAITTAANEGETAYAERIQAESGMMGPGLIIDQASGNINREAGRERAVGRATAVINKNTAEALDNEMETLSTTLPSAPPGTVSLDSIMRDTALSTERRAAAMISRMNGGSDDEVRESWEYMGTSTDPGMSDIQQLVMTKVKRIPAIVPQSAQSAATRGQFRIQQVDRTTGDAIPGTVGTMADLAANRVLSNSMSPETMAKMPEDDLRHMFTSINSDPILRTSSELRTLQNDILAYLTNPENEGSFPARKIVNQMENIMNI